MFTLTAFILSSLLTLLLASTMNLVLLEKAYFIEWELISTNSVPVVMSLILDWKTTFFLMTVCMISMFIMIYSNYYMEGDKNQTRFGFILISFVLSMALLIISPNLISLMLGWDGLGLTSYALVVFYQNEYSANSGMITILSNRVGDSTLLLGVGWLLYAGSYNFTLLSKIDSIIVLMIILSAFTKSAQIPFSAWLPAAMAAPTPVSALVHSSTLVTAGVFLMIRFAPLMKKESWLILAFVLGVSTMLMAGWAANFETDLKKVIALSTLSQLGLMFMTLGLGREDLAFLHLIMHALFKSTLFMCAGFIIHNTHNSQDSRFVGSFSFNSPLLGLIFGATNLSLCGFPFLTGFFSKDMILESSFSGQLSSFMFGLIVLATGLTLSYSLRAIFMTTSVKSKSASLSLSSDFNSTLIVATSLLFVLSISGGYILSWLISYKGFVFSMSLSEKFSIFLILSLMTFMSLFVTKNFTISKGPSVWASSLMLFLPFMTKTPLTKTALASGFWSLKLSDKGWSECSGPLGLTSSLASKSLAINKSNIIVIMTQYILGFFILVLALYMFN